MENIKFDWDIFQKGFGPELKFLSWVFNKYRKTDAFVAWFHYFRMGKWIKVHLVDLQLKKCIKMAHTAMIKTALTDAFWNVSHTFKEIRKISLCQIFFCKLTIWQIANLTAFSGYVIPMSALRNEPQKIPTIR